MTITQITAILMLLQAFGVDQSTITQIQSYLQPQLVQVVSTDMSTTTDMTVGAIPAPVETQQQVVPEAALELVTMPHLVSVQQIQTHDSYGSLTGSHPSYTISWETNIPANVDLRYEIYPSRVNSEIIDSTYYQGELDTSRSFGTLDSVTNGIFKTDIDPSKGLVIVFSTNSQKLIWRGRFQQY